MIAWKCYWQTRWWCDGLLYKRNSTSSGHNLTFVSRSAVMFSKFVPGTTLVLEQTNLTISRFLRRSTSTCCLNPELKIGAFIWCRRRSWGKTIKKKGQTRSKENERFVGRSSFVMGIVSSTPRRRQNLNFKQASRKLNCLGNELSLPRSNNACFLWALLALRCTVLSNRRRRYNNKCFFFCMIFTQLRIFFTAQLSILTTALLI